MTEQIDRDDLRNDIESILGDPASSPTPRYWAQAADKLLDALDKAERAFREEALRHGFTLRALGQAEYRATRAEAQAAIRGRAVVIYQQRARDAEARIEAVLGMCDDAEDPDQWPPRPVMHGGEPFPADLAVQDIRRALTQ